jgi:hypothetical protein
MSVSFILLENPPSNLLAPFSASFCEIAAPTVYSGTSLPCPRLVIRVPVCPLNFTLVLGLNYSNYLETNFGPSARAGV